MWLYTEGIKQNAILRDTARARELFAEAIRSDSSFAPAYYAMAANGMYSSPDEAVELARSAYRLDTANKWYHQFYGQALIYADRYDEALKVYRRLQIENPKDPDNYRILAALYEQTKSPVQAIITLDSAELRFGRIPLLGEMKRRLLLATGQVGRAIEEARREVEAAPYEARLHAVLATLYGADRKDSLARAEFDEALRIDSTNVETLMMLADFHAERQDYGALLAATRRIFLSDKVPLETKIRRFEQFTADTRFYREYYFQLNDLATTLFNYYCILTLVMVIVTSVLNIDYGPMLTHEYNAQVKDDLFTTPERPFAGADDYEEGEKHSSVLDLLVPVIVLIALCIVGLIWTGGMWDAGSENHGNFIMSFSDATAGTGLCLGSIIAIVFTFVYYWCRGLIGFNKSMEAIPNGFIQMISPILILCFAWTLCGLCRDNGLQVGSFVEGVMANTGSLAKFLPAVIFIVACFIGFATGTSWGTIGIMVPLVCAVFDWDTQMTLLSVGLAASCAGGVCGDHLSPISDTTIMASAGAHCFHLNHVATQLPYGITVAAVSFVSFIIAGLVQNAVVCMIIAIVLMVATLLVIKAVVAKKHAGVFAEMAEANKVLYQK